MIKTPARLRTKRARSLGKDGITLVELMVVIAIISILMVALGFSFTEWIGRNKVESRIKTMHVDLMNARARAMQHSRMVFIVGSPTGYRLHEDFQPGELDGDLVAEPIDDTSPCDGTPVAGRDLCYYENDVQYEITTSADFNTGVIFTKDGMVNDGSGTRLTGTGAFIRLEYDTDNIDPDYDCLALSATRVNLGLWDDANAKCVEK